MSEEVRQLLIAVNVLSLSLYYIHGPLLIFIIFGTAQNTLTIVFGFILAAILSSEFYESL